MSKLIIAEKPSVAKSIASALGASSRADGFYEGSGLIVSWCVGHLVSPMDAAGYDERFKKWRYDDLPILPEPFRYVLAPGKEDAFENLRTLMNRSDVDTVVNACDAGREGELIFRLVYEMTGCRKPVLRLWISSMEDSAIREGFSDLRPGADYEALYQSALCRQKADWLVGINATRLFSVLYHRTLNVGRVQTPTLAMLAERDAKITLFHKEKYHLLRLTLDGAEAVSEKFTDPAKAEQAAAILAALDLIAFSLQAAKQFFQVGTGWQESVNGRFQLCLIAGAVLFSLMFNIALALVLSWNDDGQTVFLAKPVGDTADIVIASLVGMIVLVIRKADRIENQVVMNMIFVYMGGKYKFILAAQDFFCKLHADLMGLFRRDLPRLKGLDQVTAQVRSLVDGMAAGPGKFDIRSFGGTAIGRYKQLSIRLFRVADIVNGRFQR